MEDIAGNRDRPDTAAPHGGNGRNGGDLLDHLGGIEMGCCRKSFLVSVGLGSRCPRPRSVDDLYSVACECVSMRMADARAEVGNDIPVKGALV